MTAPFASGYQTAWMTLGIIAGWMTVVLGLAFYARERHRARALPSLPPLHGAGLVHTFTEDTATPGGRGSSR